MWPVTTVPTKRLSIETQSAFVGKKLRTSISSGLVTKADFGISRLAGNHYVIWRAPAPHAIRCWTPSAEKERGDVCVCDRIHPVLQRAVRGNRSCAELVKQGLMEWVPKAGMSLVWAGQARSRVDRGVLSLQRMSLGVSRCRLSAGAQVKAALWFPLGGWGGPLRSAGLDPLSGWLPEDLVLDWPLVGMQEEQAVKDETDVFIFKCSSQKTGTVFEKHEYSVRPMKTFKVICVFIYLSPMCLCWLNRQRKAP